MVGNRLSPLGVVNYYRARYYDPVSGRFLNERVDSLLEFKVFSFLKEVQENFLSFLSV